MDDDEIEVAARSEWQRDSHESLDNLVSKQKFGSHYLSQVVLRVCGGLVQ